MDKAQRESLFRYRAMAYFVGVGLLVLVCVGVPLQYAAGRPTVVAVVGPIHGFLYIVYLITVADIARRFHLRLGRVIALVAAGFVPFLAFVVERLTTRRIEGEGQSVETGGPLADGERGARR